MKYNIGNLALSRALGDFEFKKAADLPPEQQAVTGMTYRHI
jgi:protein phosphatase 2C family protein 2/3